MSRMSHLSHHIGVLLGLLLGLGLVGRGCATGEGGLLDDDKSSDDDQVDDDSSDDDQVDDDQGADNDASADDDSGTPVFTGAGWVWVDSTGAQVTDGETLLFFDDDGYQWYVDPSSATVIIQEVPVYFDSLTCSGTGHVQGVTPMEPFQTVRSDTYYACPSNIPAETFWATSYQVQYGACQSTGVSILAVSLEYCAPFALNTPDIPWSAPLHRERI